MKKKSLGSDEFLYCFEIFIPLADKDGCRIEPGIILNIKDELIEKFGGLTMTSIWGNPVYDGFWKSSKTKKIVQDRNAIMTVLTPRDRDSIEYFIERKVSWQVNLNQEEFLITVHEIQSV